MRARTRFLPVGAIAPWVLAAALAATAGSALAAGEPKFTADQIVDRNVAARGGLAAWRAIQTMGMTGTMDAGQLHPNPGPEITDVRAAKKHRHAIPVRPPEGKTIALPFVLQLKRPRMMRLEVEFQGQTAIQVYDGEQGFKYRPYLGRSDWQPFTPDELRLAAAQQPLDGPLIDYKAKGTRVSLEGSDTVTGRAAYRLRLELKSGEVRHVWVDAETFLDVRIDGERRIDGHPRPMYTLASDFRKVDGVTVPFLLETSVEGISRTERIHVDKVLLNPPLESGRFAKPAG